MLQLQQEGTLFEQVSGAVKKLVLVSPTSTLVTGAREEALEHIPCILYPFQFKKNKIQVQALIDSSRILWKDLLGGYC